MQNLTFKNLKA